MEHVETRAGLSHAGRWGAQPKRKTPTSICSKNCRNRNTLLPRKESGVSQTRLLKMRVKAF
jgi:hypothetical protein